MLQRRKRRARLGFTLIELMIVIAIIGVLAAIAVPNFQAARQRANIRACYANQKTVAGAIEMYNLDFNTSVRDLDAGLFTALQANGYLQSIPNDPGQGAGSSTQYTMEDVTGGVAVGGNVPRNVTCAAHGPIQAPSS